MILPDFVLRTRANQCWDQSGIDSLEKCFDQQHFLQYPHPVSYVYNSRGFRDSEWPDHVDQLKNAIWCVGDSFTVGLGSPYEHIWPQRLQQARGQRTINVSMDGASNNWIARRACAILQAICPCVMIIQWSYISRREKPDTSLMDEQRLLQSINCSTEEDIANTLHCIDQVQHSAGSCRIIHSFIPDFLPWKLKGTIESRVDGLVIPEIQRRDLARDGHHYDVLTSDQFVADLQPLLT